MRILKNNVSIFILAGGRGRRFWPLSRERKPKQFLSIFNGQSMLKMTYNRFKKITKNENIYIITSLDQVNLIKKQLPYLKSENLVIEPEPKGTAAAIGLAAVKMKTISPQGIMVVVPADQHIQGEDEFRKVIIKAINAAKLEDVLITIGVKPSFASTGYGYLEFGKRTKIGGGFFYNVDKFTEKPSKKTASRYIKSKKYYFNSGMFIWKTSTYLEELKIYMPKLYKILIDIAKKEKKFNSKKEGNKISSIYKKIKSTSVDYGLMQKTDNIKAEKATFKWSDLGSLRSLEEIILKVKGNTITNALNIAKDTKNCIIYGKKNHLIATIGISNLIIIQTPDVTLVANKDNAQKVKNMVNKISRNKNTKKFT